MALFSRESGRYGVRFRESNWGNDPVKLAFIMDELKILELDICVLVSREGFVDFVGNSFANQFKREEAERVDDFIGELLQNLDRYMALEEKCLIMKKAIRKIDGSRLKAIADILLGADALSIEAYEELIK